MKKLFLLFLITLIWQKGKANFIFSPTIKTAYENILRLRLDEGKALLDKEQKENPANALPLLYYNYIDFLKAFITEEKTYSDSLRFNAEHRLRSLGHESKDSPFFLFSQAEIILQTAFIKFKFREYVSGAFDARKSYKLAEDNSKRFPDFTLNRQLMGLLHAMMGDVPREYHWLVNLAGMEGTTVQGMDEMRSAMDKLSGTDYSICNEEILFYMAQLQSSISIDGTQELALLNSLKPYISQSLLLTYCYVNLAMKAGRNEESLAALNQPGIYKNTFPFPYLNYKKGLIGLRKLDWNSASEFHYFLDHFKGINMVKAAYQKLGWIALLNGDKKKYKEYMDSCAVHGKDITDEDKDALNESKDSLPPDIILLRARLLFDGGYYQQAFKEISVMKLSSSLPLRSQLEYTYRYARLFQKTDMPDKAVQFYEYTLTNGKNERWYFAANSALLLANMYEEKKDYSKAKEYYQNCLSMRHHDYQNSIDQKAQAGLDRVKSKV